MSGLTGISSMATRALLASLVTQYARANGVHVHIESVGGVDAAKRVQAGEAFDIVLLASDAIDRLIVGGYALAGTRTDWAQSHVAACVRAGAPLPDWSSSAAVYAAVLAATTIGVSTGPSGAALLDLFARWGIGETVAARLITTAPGVPIASLVARGEVELGFQQRSELHDVPGIVVIGALPADCAITTAFSSAVVKSCTQPAVAAAFLQFLVTPNIAALKQAHGMQSVV